MAKDADPEVERGRSQSQDRSKEVRGKRSEIGSQRERPGSKTACTTPAEPILTGRGVEGRNERPDVWGSSPPFHLRAGAGSPIYAPPGRSYVGVLPPFASERERRVPNSGAARLVARRFPPVCHPPTIAASLISAAAGRGSGGVPQFPPSRQRSEPNSGATRPGVWGCPPPFPSPGVGAGRGIEQRVRIHQSNSKEGPWSYSKRWNKRTRKEQLT